MNTKIINSPNGLKICCSFVELVKSVEIDKDLIELFWFSLEVKKEICNNCK